MKDEVVRESCALCGLDFCTGGLYCYEEKCYDNISETMTGLLMHDECYEDYLNSPSGIEEWKSKTCSHGEWLTSYCSSCDVLSPDS